MVTTLLISSVAWDHNYGWLLLPFLILLSPELQKRLGTRHYLSAMALAFLSYVTMASPSTLYRISLPLADASISARIAPTLLLSIKVYGALFLCIVFVYLTLRLRPEPGKLASSRAT
jgi:hypothetical protein